MENHTPQDAPGHDAQRELEQRALRNVRGLVDRLEAEEASRRISMKWVAAVLVAVAAVLAAIVMASLDRRGGGAREIEVPPAAKPPARQGQATRDLPQAGCGSSTSPRLASIGATMGSRPRKARYASEGSSVAPAAYT